MPTTCEPISSDHSDTGESTDAAEVKEVKKIKFLRNSAQFSSSQFQPQMSTAVYSFAARSWQSFPKTRCFL